MYTQCPDCSTAFRVTADVLKQAAGKVRCGGCGNAFNALAYLSETPPQQTRPKEAEAEAALPELKPDSMPDNGLPASISAEQSAALLKTLDELAGSDIRIEDTGVEWRVLDDDEIGHGAADEELVIDEVLDESPTPVDQFLTETPAVVDSPEIFEEPPLEFSRTSVDEIRFDDNTVLPDDFDLDDDGFVEGDFTTEAAPEEPAAEDPEEPGDDDPQVDLDLSEPDEWTDILGEFADLAEAVAAPVGDEQEQEHEPDTQQALDAEPEDESELEAEPELDSDIEEELDALEIPTDDDDVDEPLDMDSQFALQAEAMGIDLSGMHETVEAEKNALADEDVDLETLLKDSRQEDLELDDLLDEELVEELEEDELEPVSDDAEQLDLIDDDEVEDHVVDEEVDAEIEDEAEAELEEDPEAELEAEPEVELEEELEVELEQEDDEDASEELYVPPMTEEEQTINMQIDQDLLALAVEDEDGFASTIVIPEAEAETKAGKDKKKKRKDKKKSKKHAVEDPLKETGAGFETIIMEGEAFRSTEDNEKLEADAAEAQALLRKAAEEEAAALKANSGRISYGLVAGIVALLVLLAAQYIHQSRETLATIPAFNNAVGPLYRAIGQPLSPSWDITGWRFEVAKGTEEDDESLTIYSRLGNKSKQALPYPLIGVSLTDLYEETIGSRVLDPADYLPKELDPRKLVQPGNTFEAVITIQTPAEATEGFRLRACYRTTDGLLRCKDDGFK